MKRGDLRCNADGFRFDMLAVEGEATSWCQSVAVLDVSVLICWSWNVFFLFGDVETGIYYSFSRIKFMLLQYGCMFPSGMLPHEEISIFGLCGLGKMATRLGIRNLFFWNVRRRQKQGGKMGDTMWFTRANEWAVSNSSMWTFLSQMACKDSRILASHSLVREERCFSRTLGFWHCHVDQISLIKALILPCMLYLLVLERDRSQWNRGCVIQDKVWSRTRHALWILELPKKVKGRRWHDGQGSFRGALDRICSKGDVLQTVRNHLETKGKDTPSPRTLPGGYAISVTYLRLIGAKKSDWKLRHFVLRLHYTPLALS